MLLLGQQAILSIIESIISAISPEYNKLKTIWKSHDGIYMYTLNTNTKTY